MTGVVGLGWWVPFHPRLAAYTSGVFSFGPLAVPLEDPLSGCGVTLSKMCFLLRPLRIHLRPYR